MTQYSPYSRKRQASNALDKARKCEEECGNLQRHFADKRQLSDELASEMNQFKAKIDFLKRDQNLNGKIDKDELAQASSSLARRVPSGRTGNGILALLELLAKAIDAIVTEARRNRQIERLSLKMREAYRQYSQKKDTIDGLISDTNRIRRDLRCTGTCAPKRYP